MRRQSAIHPGLLAAIVLVTGLAVSSARADIWKWVDAHGQTHYSDHWKQGAVLLKDGDADHPVDSSGADDQAQQNATDQQITGELDREAAQRAVQKDEAATRAKQCKQAQERYQQLIRARRVYREDKNGAREYLSDQDADKRRVQARLDMQTACGNDTSPNAS